MSHDAGTSAESGRPTENKPEVTIFSPLDNTVRDDEFNFRDGNVYIKVENHVFFVHEFKIFKFRKVEPMLALQPSHPHRVIGLEGSVEDFKNTFRVIYASPDSTSNLEFGVPVLVSALRIATKFDQPQLREFAINRLESKKLPVMEYFPLAREFGILNWEVKALEHLATRNSTITEAEGKMIGIKSLIAAAARRERRAAQRHNPVPKPLVRVKKPAARKVITPDGAPTTNHQSSSNPSSSALTNLGSSTLEAGSTRQRKSLSPPCFVSDSPPLSPS